MIDLVRVEGTERLTRYLDEKSKFSPVNKRVKFNAFTPPPSNFKLSIYRTHELSAEEIWELGDKYVAPVRKRLILARADISAIECIDRGLAIEPYPDPHERHANVVNWPRKQEGEDGWLKLATELANAAELTVR